MRFDRCREAAVLLDLAAPGRSQGTALLALAAGVAFLLTALAACPAGEAKTCPAGEANPCPSAEAGDGLGGADPDQNAAPPQDPPQDPPQNPPAAGGETANRTGGWRLAAEKSVYLREHADNPVEWYPWGEEAFARAKAEGKVIYVSSGYSSCHWCHVMRRNTFMQPEVAAILNKKFICIKIDREELPQIDDYCMTALSVLGSGGGWPLSAFLTPDKLPFMGAGQYLNPDDFSFLIRDVQVAWTEEREQVLEIAASVQERIAQFRSARHAEAEPRPLLEAGVSAILERYDPEQGGFAFPPNFAPKFPPAREIVLLLALSALEDAPAARACAIHTLQAMARGGIFDQVGGGFHRYAVDRTWAVPHFEKMLYNQGTLAEAYLDGYRLAGDESFAAVARRTLDALLADFSVASGGFAAAFDADSGGEEGTFYLWTPEEVEAAAGSELAPLLTRTLGITKEGNMVKGRSLPRMARAAVELAVELGKPAAEITGQLDEGLKRMRAYRQTRAAPRRDDKVILGWNACAVSALARGGALLGEERYLNAARAAQAFADKNMRGAAGFTRRHLDGESKFPATLQDAALHLRASLDLYDATLELEHVVRAISICEQILAEFGGARVPGGGDFQSPPLEGGLFEGGANSAFPAARFMRFEDDVLPSGNMVLAGCLHRLWLLTAKEDYAKRRDAILAAARATLANFPQESPEMLLATLAVEAREPLIVVAGELRGEETQALLRAVRSAKLPFAALAHRPPAEAGIKASIVLPLLRACAAPPKGALAYVFVDGAWRPPIADAPALAAALAAILADMRAERAKLKDVKEPAPEQH